MLLLDAAPDLRHLIAMDEKQVEPDEGRPPVSAFKDRGLGIEGVENGAAVVLVVPADLPGPRGGGDVDFRKARLEKGGVLGKRQKQDGQEDAQHQFPS